MNDSSQFTGGGTHFIHNNITCKPQKAGNAVLFSGKNLHEGVAVTTGIRYILTGFCEYTYHVIDNDHTINNNTNMLNNAHDSFMNDYDPIYDGYAATGGLRTGDVIKGVYFEDVLYIIDDIHTLPILLELYRSTNNDTTTNNNTSTNDKTNKTGVSYSFLIERLTVIDNLNYTMLSKHTNNTNNVINTNNTTDTTIPVNDNNSNNNNINMDDQMIIDLIQQSDLFLTVGQYWKLDDI